MRRRSIAIASAVTAVLIGGLVVSQGRPGDSDTAAPEPTATRPTDSGAEPDAARQLKDEQLQAALEELREQTTAFTERHHLVVTIRDDPPLDIWTADGETCVIDARSPAMIVVARADTTQVQLGEVPFQATMLGDGGCQATTTVAVDDEPTYYLSVKLPGRDDPKVTPFRRTVTPQTVTLLR